MQVTHFPHKLNFLIRANETLDSSARRKKKFDPSLKGRKPDFEVHVSMNQRKENLLVLEIKSTDHAWPNKDILNDLVKLANELKDCIDKIIDDGLWNISWRQVIHYCFKWAKTFNGLTINSTVTIGPKCTFYIMDLWYESNWVYSTCLEIGIIFVLLIMLWKYSFMHK